MDNIEILRLKSQGYCCSQIMVKQVLDIMDRDNPDLVDFAKGLCLGHGSKTGDCGILTAGICILAMYAPGDPELGALLRETFLNDFRTLSGGITSCGDITGPLYPEMDPERCGTLLGRAHARLLEILVENGIDPADPDA